MNRLKSRHRLIYESLIELGGEATVKEIAEAAGLNTNGVSQSLGAAALAKMIERVPHEERWKAGDEKYRVIEQDEDAGQ